MIRLTRMPRLCLPVLMFNLVALTACGDSYEGGTATTPEPRNDGWWQKLHESFLDRAKQGDVDLLFMGDSITQGWSNNDVWKRYYGPRKPANFGIGGDRTQHVLWRLDHGEMEGISPKVIVLMIGTNNIGNNTPEEIAEGVRAIVDRMKSAAPQAKILLLGVFPRGATRNKEAQTDKLDPRPGQINEIIKKLDDDKNVCYLDIKDAFIGDDGLLHKDLMPDFLHLSPAGYRHWAEAMEPTLWDLLENK
ncbi:MAG TPA: platelet-activating factor acetylhydrolase IB subunit [Isosphaeraceae bacterium]|nr:platelet-activating factor acetylhydrolase IB subunit [Isosphaeraceae bacterium]